MVTVPAKAEGDGAAHKVPASCAHSQAEATGQESVAKGQKKAGSDPGGADQSI